MEKKPIQKPIAENTEDALPARLADPSRVSNPKAVRRLTSEDILAGAIEVEIDHNGTLYRLRRTSMGKLILTK